MKIDMKEVLELPCCIEAPPEFIAKAQYALHTLLLPLGIQPIWVQRDSLGSMGIYYGSEIQQVDSGIIAIPLQNTTVQYFSKREKYPVQRACWRFWENERWPVLFGGPTEADDDIIASSFFWLSGWQEYTTRERDIHGRFAFASSLQEAFSMGNQPVVDAYRERLAHRFLEVGIPFKRRTWGGKRWAFCPTHDIDYLKKWRLGMVYRELVEYLLGNRLNQPVSGRLTRFASFLADWVKPGDVFKKSLLRIIRETKERGGKGTYFFKTGAHGPRDVYYSITSSFVLNVLSHLKEVDFEVGLHPSYFAHNHSTYMHQEKVLLEASLKQEITSVRQHYLRYQSILTSYIHFTEGFAIDSTIAFAEHEGFRRGTCHPFELFDIYENRTLGIWEMPLSIMDGALFNRRMLDANQSADVTREVIQRCKRFGGVCVALWHNTLWDELDFPGWGDHFIKSMDYAVQEDAFINTLHNSLETYLTSLA